MPAAPAAEPEPEPPDTRQPQPARWHVSHALYDTARWQGAAASGSSAACEFYSAQEDAVCAFKGGSVSRAARAKIGRLAQAPNWCFWLTQFYSSSYTYY